MCWPFCSFTPMLTYNHITHEWHLCGSVRLLADWGDAIMEVWAKKIDPSYDFEEKIFVPLEGYPGYFRCDDSLYSEEGKVIYEKMVERRKQYLSLK